MKKIPNNSNVITTRDESTMKAIINPEKLEPPRKQNKHTGSLKHLYRIEKNLVLSDWILLLQNGCNEMVIKLRVLQFWYEIIIVI